ncbi:MAG: hypothetical protein M1827_004057 [Pycnora praestabilis]|nr:MAG: hypothetical protein M1827_004057 [Pycnora praestabilis]
MTQVRAMRSSSTHVESASVQGEETSLDRTLSQKLSHFSILREVLFIAELCCTQLVTQAAVGQAVVTLHIVGPGLKTTLSGELSWFAAAFSLTVGTFVLIAGRLGDIYGHQRMFLGGWLWFGLWSLIAGLTVYTTSPIFFDVCRAFQGIGPAFLLPNSLAILGRAYKPGKKKDMVFALFASTAPTGALMGALFGALLAQRAWWPWIYWINSIVCTVLAVMGYFVIPVDDKADNVNPQTFDFWGALLGVTGLILINFSWNQAPIVGWGTPYIYAILILGLGLLIAFGLYERTVKQPLLPPGILNGGAACILVLVALGWSSFGIWLYYTLQLIEVLRGNTPVSAALQFIPEALSGICAAITTGYLLSRVRTSYLMVAALMAFCTGCVFSATAPVKQTYWINIFLSMLIMSWGMDISFPASTILLSNLVPRSQQGIAASLINTIVNYSISIGLGLAGTVENNVNKGGRDVERGYRAALYTSVGLSGVGLLISIIFAMYTASKKTVMS